MNKKLKIVFVTNNYKPYSGGVVSSIDATVNALQKVGHTVFIVAPDFLGAQHNDPAHVVRVPSLIKFTYKNNYVSAPFFYDAQVKKIIQKLKPDIIHAHHPWLLGSSALKAARFAGVPIFFTYHTMYEHYTHYVPLPEVITKPLVKKVALEFCNKVDGVIAPSKIIFNDLQSKVKKPVTLLPSPLQNIFFKKKEKVIKPDNRFHVLTVGRLVKEKNIPFLLDVFAQLDKQKFKMTIVGYGAQYESIKKYAYSTLQLSFDDCVFVHKPKKEIIAQHYQQADLFLFSSHTDTQGLVLAEAMAAGLPVVAVHGPGQEDIINHGSNGFLVDSVDDMVSTINTIQSNKALMEQCKQHALKTARNYGQDVFVHNLVQRYRFAFV